MTTHDILRILEDGSTLALASDQAATAGVRRQELEQLDFRGLVQRKEQLDGEVIYAITPAGRRHLARLEAL